jgi:hypothetical protein
MLMTGGDHGLEPERQRGEHTSGAEECEVCRLVYLRIIRMGVWRWLGLY